MVEIKFVRSESIGKLDDPPTLYEAGKDLTRMIGETGVVGKLESVSLVFAEYDQKQDHTGIVLMLVYRKPAS